MAHDPWLTIIGLGEDGPNGLPPTSRAALDNADIVMAPPRHLDLVPNTGAERIEWPVPFADGLPILLGLRGRRTVVLASGDPFWFGAGSVIAAKLGRAEWRAFPGPSTFALAAARLGWPLDRTLCRGLHAAPLTRLVPDLTDGARILVLLRDGAAVADLATLLRARGFGASRMHMFEALGGPREHQTSALATDDLSAPVFTHPVCAAIEVAGTGQALPRCSGLPDVTFDHDGQITKRPIRALTLSALAPLPGERLWDIGGGSGSIAIEWLLSHPTTHAISIEPRAERAARIRANADMLGADRLEVITGTAPEALDGLPPPDAVFIGGGLSDEMLTALATVCAPGTRLVANAVTLESEALLSRWQAEKGGTLMRVDLSQMVPLGRKRGWQAAHPVVQWSVTL